MAEDREDATPGNNEVDEFEVLDEVGEVEGWDDNLLPDDEEEVIVVAEKSTSSPDDRKPVKTGTVDSSVKPVSIKNEPLAVLDKVNQDQSGKSLNNQTPTDKAKESLVGQNENSGSEGEKPTAVGKDKIASNSESLTSKNEKQLTDSSTSKDGILLNESSVIKDGKLLNESTDGKDGKPSNESSASTDGKPTNELTTSKDGKILNEVDVSKAEPSSESTAKKEGKSSEAAASKERKPSVETVPSKEGKPSSVLAGSKEGKPSSETASSKDGKSSETATNKDVKSSSQTATNKDGKSSQTTTNKDGKSSQTTTNKDVKSSSQTATNKDVKSSSQTASNKDVKSSSQTASNKDAKSSSQTASNKDVKSSSQTASNKDVKSSSETVSSKDVKSSSETVSSKDRKSSSGLSVNKDGKISNESAASKGGKSSDSLPGKEGKLSSNQSSPIKITEDKKRTDAKNNESRKQTTGTASKRKSDEAVAPKSGEKKIKLSTDNMEKSSEQEIDGIFSLDPKEEHAIKKEQFVEMMANLSEELKNKRDFRRWADKHRKDGMMFPMFELRQPREIVLFSRCQLISGYEPNCHKLCLGIRRNKSIRRFWGCEKKFVTTVRKVVKAFEEMVESSGKPLFDPNTQLGYWHSMGVHANSRDQAILQVHLHAKDKQEGEARFSQAKNILLSTFKPKKGQNNCISSIYLRLVINNRSNSAERMANCCIMGLGFINEVLKNVTIRLYPWTYFSTGTSAMSALCEELMSIFIREGCETLVEIGCRTGVIGQLLSKYCKMVLGIDTATFVADAKQNADENKLTNCKYFDGKFKDALVAFNKELQSTGSITVVVNAMCYDMADDVEVLDWLRRTEKVHKIVYIKPVTPNDKTSHVVNLCTSGKEIRRSPRDPMPYLPLYALPVDLGTKTYTAVIVLKHVENNVINELYRLRIDSAAQYNSGGNLGTTTKLMVVGDKKQGSKSYGKSAYTNKNVLVSKSNDQNTKLKTSTKISQNRDRSRSPITRSKVPGGRGNNQDRNRTNVKSGARKRSRSGSRGPGKRQASKRKHEDIDHTSRSGPHLHGDHGTQKKTDHSSESRNVWVNEDGLLTTRVDAPRHGVDALQTRDLRNVLQSRPEHRQLDSLLDPKRLISHKEIRDLRTVLQGKRMYAERPSEVAKDIPDRFKQNVIHDVTKRKVADSSFTHDIFPPGTEDLRHVLQEKKVMVEKFGSDRNIKGRDFHDLSVVDSDRSRFRVKESHDLRSFIEENRASHRIVEKDSFREAARPPNNAETWSGSHTGVNSSSSKYPSSMWGQQGQRDTELEAFPLAKDSALFDREIGNKTRGNDKKVMFSNSQNLQSYNFGLHGPGRSFDDAVLGRTRSRADDIASGTRTDVRGLSSASGTRTDVRGLSKSWRLRDLHDMESIHESFNKFDQHRNVMPVGVKTDFQHGWKGRSEFETSANSTRRALSPSSKLHIVSDIQKEIPYHSNDKSHFYGAAERNKINLESDRSRLMFNEADRRRTIIDGSERNRTVGESAIGRHFSGTERTAADGPDRDRNVFDGTRNRNRTVFGELDNRNKSGFGGPEDRNRSVFSEQDRNRSALIAPEDRSRSGLSGPEDRNRSFGRPEDRNRSVFVGPEDRNRSVLSGAEGSRSNLSGPEDRNRSMFDAPDDRNRSLFGRPEDRNKHIYGESEGRNRSVFGVPEDSFAFDGVDNRNRAVIEEIDRNRALVIEADRNRIFGGPTELNRKGYHSADSKNVIPGYGNRGYEVDKLFVNKEPLKSDLYNFRDTVESKIAHRREDILINQNPQHDKSKPHPPTLDGRNKEKSTYYHDEKHNLNDTKRSGHDNKEKFKERELPDKVYGIPVLQRDYSAQGRNKKKSVLQSEPKYRSSSSYESRAPEKKYTQESVQNRDAKNIYVGDRPSEKASVPFWAGDKNISDVSRAPSSTNREWDRMEQSGTSHRGPAIPWVDTRRGDDKQRDVQGRHDSAGKSYRTSQPVEEKQWSQLPSQHLGKYGLQEERQRKVEISAPQTFRDGNFPRKDPQSARGLGIPATAATYETVPQAYEHVLQQLLSTGNISAALSAMLPGVNLDKVQSFSSSPRDNSGGRSGQSGSRVFQWMN